MPYLDCEVCDEAFYAKPSRLKRGSSTRYCSMDCRHLAEKTDRFIRSDGYASVKDDDGKWILEHRQLMERHIGRKLDTREHVHHKNGVKDDNRLENLEVLSVEDHALLHAPSKFHSKWVPKTCEFCDEEFEKRLSEVRKTKDSYCSRVCYLEGVFWNAIPKTFHLEKGQKVRPKDLSKWNENPQAFTKRLVDRGMLSKIARGRYKSTDTYSHPNQKND